MNVWNKIKIVLAFAVLQTILINAASATEGNYSRISASADKPPLGTAIDENLTEYYNLTTATGLNGTYWWAGGAWYDEQEMIKLPYRKPENGLYGNVVQDQKNKDMDKCKKDKDKNKDKDNCDIDVPVSNWVVAGFVLSALVLQKAVKLVK